jgi:hypothetical protein
LENELQTIELEKSNLHYIYNNAKKNYDVLDLSTGKYLDSVIYEPQSAIYNLQMADTICDKIRAGQTLKQICQTPNMPTSTRFYAWLALYPELRVRYEQARKQRADSFHDQALEIALSMPNKDMVPGCKLAVDTLKWAAEKASPDYYGKKEEKASIGSINVVLHTGVIDSVAPKDIIIDEFGNFKGFDTGNGENLLQDVEVTVIDTKQSSERWEIADGKIKEGTDSEGSV